MKNIEFIFQFLHIQISLSNELSITKTTTSIFVQHTYTTSKYMVLYSTLNTLNTVTSKVSKNFNSQQPLFSHSHASFTFLPILYVSPLLSFPLQTVSLSLSLLYFLLPINQCLVPIPIRKPSLSTLQNNDAVSLEEEKKPSRTNFAIRR